LSKTSTTTTTTTTTTTKQNVDPREHCMLLRVKKILQGISVAVPVEEKQQQQHN
jgi:hypothetical protein